MIIGLCRSWQRMREKSIALKKMAGMLEVPEGKVVAAGDNYNDVDMIQAADIGVAMEMLRTR